LIKYSEVEKDDTLSKEQKIEAIKKQLEEAAALEMPSMQQNLPIVATMTTLGTLVGLLGTVLGMIKSFQALATAGAPGFVDRYFGGPCEHCFRYCNRCFGCYFI
jgi:biopolymer transport protein ExbB